MKLEEDNVRLTLYVLLSQPGVSLDTPFFRHARKHGQGRGHSVVDMTPDRMYEYARGLHHFFDDMQALPFSVTPEESHAAVDHFVMMQEIREMMAMRDECVNMKKVLLHLQHYGKKLLAQLRRLSICFYAGRNIDGSLKKSAKTSLHSRSKSKPKSKAQAEAEMQAEMQAGLNGVDEDVHLVQQDFDVHQDIGASLNACKGLVSGINDARQVMKAICCVPRHPQDYEELKSLKLREMPRSLFMAKALPTCVHLLDKYYPSHKVDKSLQLALQLNSVRSFRSGIRVEKLFSAVYGFVAHHQLDHPLECAFFIKQSLIARGITKAFYVVEEVENYILALEALTLDYDDTLTVLEAIQSDAEMDPADNVMVQVYIARFGSLRDILRLLLPVLQRLVEEKGAVPLFRGGDDAEVGDRLPSEFAIGHYFTSHEKMVERYAGRMETVLAAVDLKSQTSFVRGDSKCFRCKGKFHHLWVMKKVCYWCVKDWRSRNRCPFRDKCSPKTFCAHTSECFLCDARSCDECKFYQGNGMDVVHFLRDRADRLEGLYLDFDQTICSTRNGLSPLDGKHFVEPSLLEVLVGNYPRLKEIAIVTKNSHVDDIRTFLMQYGVDSEIHIRCVKGISKATAIKVYPNSVLVDDDIRELTDDEVEILSVSRFLYHPTKR